MKRMPPPAPFLPLAYAAAAALLGGCDSSAAKTARFAAPSARPAMVAVGAAPRPLQHLLPQALAAPEPAKDVAIKNVFAATSWQAPLPPAPPPSAAPPTPLAPPPPTAPPMPFRFIGRYGDADSLIVMLVKGDQLYLVSVGDTIDSAYRIERVSGSMVELTYLPLKLKQSLSTGDAG